MKYLSLLAVSFVSLMAHAEYGGTPFYAFQRTVRPDEKIDSKIVMADCRKAMETEKKKIDALSYHILDESPCTMTSEVNGYLVRAFFNFLK